MSKGNAAPPGPSASPGVRHTVPVRVPCHRVVGAQGTLVGFARGIEAKAALLRSEGWRPRGARNGRRHVVKN